MNSRRIVFGFDRTDIKPVDRRLIPTTELSAVDFSEALKKAYEYLRDYCGVHGLRPNFEFRSMKFVEGDLHPFLQHLNSTPELLKDTRVIVSNTDIALTQVDSNGKALFAVSSADTPSYNDVNGDGTKFEVAMNPAWMAKFIFDYFLELYVANSIPAVKRFVEENSLRDLYKLKDQFIKVQISNQNLPDVFDSGASNFTYACFHNSLRSSRELLSHTQLLSAVRLWDAFVHTELAGHATTSETLDADLRAWRTVYGQISQRNLSQSLMSRGPGTYILLKQKRSVIHRRPEITFEQLRTVFGESESRTRRSNLYRGIAVFEESELADDERWRLIERMIDSNYLQMFRIWFR